MHFIEVHFLLCSYINEIALCAMKSSLNSDEIFSLWLQMKLNPPLFSRQSRISSRSDFILLGGYIPPTADLVEKRLAYASLFSWGG